MKLLVKGVRIWSFGGKQLYPWRLLKIVAHQKCVMFCLYDSVDLPPATKGPNAYFLKLGRNDHLLERYAVEENFFADLRWAWRQPDVCHGHTLGEGGLEEGGDICAHEIDFHKSVALFTRSRADVVKVAWETEVFNTRPAKCTFRQRSGLVGLVHCKGDGCKREAALESMSAQLSPWCKDIAVICLSADADSAEGAALRKHPSTALNTARGHNLPKDVAALESSIF